ncbi:hypothetical protein [Mycoplasmopsis edwardii]|uniref:Uncharacterized protein n=1 Tax=Mycoplasmopsis edwardii TaxID=53558 RepID=A0ACD4PHJ0_9BACT|nr:hypothetical protein [Mycoplasmopsis edwardii]WBP84050.1 hypothetical protein Me_995_000684 [Mycoplasmopsis edwardii]
MKYLKTLFLTTGLTLTTATLMISCAKQPEDKKVAETKEEPKPTTNDSSSTSSQTSPSNESTNPSPSNSGEPSTAKPSNDSSVQNNESNKLEILATASNFTITPDATLGRLSFDIILNKTLENIYDDTEYKIVINGKEYEIQGIQNNHGSNQYSWDLDNLVKGTYKVQYIKNKANKVIYANNENNEEGKTVEL